MGGTNPWKAPKIHTPVPVQSAFYTDIYSLGLLLWLIYIDGMNPIDLVVGAKWQGLARIREIGRIKHKGTILGLAQGHDWTRYWFFRHHGSSISQRIASLWIDWVKITQTSKGPPSAF